MKPCDKKAKQFLGLSVSSFGFCVMLLSLTPIFVCVHLNGLTSAYNIQCLMVRYVIIAPFLSHDHDVQIGPERANFAENVFLSLNTDFFAVKTSKFFLKLQKEPILNNINITWCKSHC